MAVRPDAASSVAEGIVAPETGEATGLDAIVVSGVPGTGG
jgi:hypothetical protein